MLPAEQQRLVFEPCRVNELERIAVAASQIDACDFRGERCARGDDGPVRRHVRAFRATGRGGSVRMGSMNTAKPAPMSSSPAEIRNGKSYLPVR